jgi:ketosteroid isomerase-like protein
VLPRRAFNVMLALGATTMAAGTAAGAFMSDARASSADCDQPANVPGITSDDFRQYVAAFNRGDFAGFGRFYADAVDFQGQGGHFTGREQVLDFYRNVKSHLQETLTIRELVVGAQAILADIVTELSAFRDWPDFPTGPLKQGDRRISENFIWYDVAAARFTRVRSAHYRSGSFGTDTDYAATGRDAPDDCRVQTGMSIEKFASYIDAFNRDDYRGFGDYYHEDVVLVIAGRTQLRGRQAIFDFYKTVKSQTRRTIQINKVITTPHQLVAELQSEFLALQDLPHFAAGPMKKGGRTFINTFVIYDLREGKFARIRSAEFRKIVRA